MGPCKVNDVELPDGTTAKAQGVLVERCRPAHCSETRSPNPYRDLFDLTLTLYLGRLKCCWQVQGGELVPPEGMER